MDLRADGLVQVSTWAAGDQFPRPVGDPVELVWPLPDEDLADLRWYLEQYLRLPTAVYEERGARVAARLAGWGEQVFAAVFATAAAREAYASARARGGGVEIALMSKSAEQLGRPWELMSAPGRGVPVALDGVAVSRTLQSTGMAEVFDFPGSRLRVLMVISRPQGAADVGYQMIARPLLRRLEAVRGSVELVVLRPPTLERLQEALAEAREAGEPFQVVHFDGHGVFGQAPVAGSAGGWGAVMYDAPGPRGMLAFEKPGGGSDLVEAGRVAQVLAGARVPVVVLNACQSAQVGSQVEAAVATRLLAEGCASVVAMAYSVYAVAAAEFMTAFYERLFAGDRVTDAVTAGRRQLRLNDRRPSMKGMLPLADWMVPVLYTRGEARFPHLRTTRKAGEAVGDILTRIREQTEAGPQPGPGLDLEAVGDFVGRDGAFYTLDVAARLQHVVVVHGPGGTGKTELAKAFGRWWRDTGGVDQAGWVIWHSFEPGVASFGLDGVINAIGERVFDAQFKLFDAEQRQAAVEEVLRGYRLLLIWDNFESVREMPDPGRATPPLPQGEQDRMRDFLTRVSSGGKSAVVITSRTPETWLGPGMRRIELGGLQGEDATAYAEQVLAPYPSARPHRQTAAFADLMQWLDGHPLSMRLTLPHLETTGAQRLLDGLQGATALPAGGDSGDRRTSLSASVAYSFRHLSDEDQQALTVLSLFHGVADADVLGTFSTSTQAPERFRGRSNQEWAELLQRAAGLGLLAPLGAGMFRLHPALPAHLAAHWRTHTPGSHDDERAAATVALVSAHAVFGGWLETQISSGDAQFAIALIGYQQRMMGAMLGHALRQSQWDEAQQILQPLNTFWNVRGLAEEARSWSSRVRIAVESPDGTPPGLSTDAGELWMFTTGSQATRDLVAGRLDLAESTYRTVLRGLEQQPAGSSRLHYMSITYHQLGNITQDRGRLDEAEAWYRKSLAIKEELTNRAGSASTYHQLGIVAQRRGRLDEAEDWYRKSLGISEDLGDRPGMASTYHQLGMVAQNRGRWDEAENWYRKSLAITEDVGDRPSMAITYHQLGRINEERGSWDGAEDWYRQSLAIKEEVGNRPGMAITYHQLGRIGEERGRWDEAEDWYRKSLGISEDLGDRPSMASTYHQLGRVAQERGRPEEAGGLYLRSLAIEEDLGNRLGMATSYAQLGLYTDAMGDSAQALTWVVRCVSLFDEIPHPGSGTGPKHLRHLTAQLGIEAVEHAWRTVTGDPLPPAVREFALTEPDPEPE
ncbi:tetratricopeptide repeat protein [Streptomyces sp. NBC_00433]